MADVSSLCVSNKIPDNLYDLCLSKLVNYLHISKCLRDDWHSLPDNVLMDLYDKMLSERRLCILGSELSNLDRFNRMMMYSGSQLRLLQCFQAVIEHGSKLSKELASAYVARCDEQGARNNDLIHLGLRLGGFLNEAGWYADAEKVLLRCREICQSQPNTTYNKRLTLECCHRLLTTQSLYCCFPAAAETCALTLELLGLPSDNSIAPKQMPSSICVSQNTCEAGTQTDLSYRQDSAVSPSVSVGTISVLESSALFARTLASISSLLFVRCEYTAAYDWSLRALELLNDSHPPQVIVEVVRACGKASVVKRSFVRAGVLLRHAVALARLSFGQHTRTAAAMIDYGFYLLNVDSIPRSVGVYEEALRTLRLVFGRSSLHVATAQEDLAYALYVMEYSSGRFYKAREHAERAIRIIEKLVPTDHLLLASAKRVKALILEEIALDTPAAQGMCEPNLLEESEALHKSALNLSMMAFGEKNVQTAKHYGNLGRLYQSMQKFQDAETMHLKAIAIKEELLGPDDYEVGLSIGHLASLYNYHMNMHCAAEKLYFRSIAISLKLFGERYSGLEYDYRGLVHVFTQLKKHDRADFYNRLLHHWHELREQSKAEQQPALGDEKMQPLAELKAQVFNPNVD